MYTAVDEILAQGKMIAGYIDNWWFKWEIFMINWSRWRFLIDWQPSIIFPSLLFFFSIDRI